MASGQLVSDDLINEVVADRLSETDCHGGCILDGYPRTVAQAQSLERVLDKLDLPEPVVFDFYLPPAKIVERLSRRRQCPHCGGIFSLKRNADSPRCNRDGTPLIQRADDNPAIIRQRLQLYRANSADLVDFYRNRNYHQIDAARAPQQISAELMRLLDARRPAAAAHAVPQALRLSATA
jgi:adenylate kinase